MEFGLELKTLRKPSTHINVASVECRQESYVVIGYNSFESVAKLECFGNNSEKAE
jgi:hypothetical protein